MGRLIHTVVFHKFPHLDELVAYILALLYGGRIWPGINKAKIVFWDAGARTPDGRPAHQWQQEGYLLIGVGGGHLDEHPSETAERKEGECAATLMAKVVGRDKDPLWTRLLTHVRNDDVAGHGRAYDLAHLVRLLNSRHAADVGYAAIDFVWDVVKAELAYAKANPESTEVDFDLPYLAKIMMARTDHALAVEWLDAAIGAAAYHQEGLARVRQAFRRVAVVHKIRGPFGQPINFAVIESDDDMIHTFAMKRKGGGADIALIRRSNGHVAIMTNKRSGIRLRDLAQIVRLDEQWAAGRLVTTDGRTLAQEGSVPGAENWYYQLAGEMLLNGSRSAPDVQPTRLSLKDLSEAVMLAMDTSFFEVGHREKCCQGICTASKVNPCAQSFYWLHRCRAIRYFMLQKGLGNKK